MNMTIKKRIATVPVINASALPGVNSQQIRQYFRPAIGPCRVHREDHNLGRYSRRCPYYKMSYNYTYRSFAVVLNNGSALRYYGPFDEGFVEWAAPKGWKWLIDENGVCLQKKNNPAINYHPSAEELDMIRAPHHCRRMALENYVRRERMERKRREQMRPFEDRLADFGQTLDDVWVSRNDSVRAGHCRAGTNAWCQRNGITAKRIPLQHLMILSNYQPKAQLTDKGPVNNVFHAAVERHLEDCQRGFCEIG